CFSVRTRLALPEAVAQRSAGRPRCSVIARRLGAELRDQLVGVVAGALRAGRRVGLEILVLAHRHGDLELFAARLTLELIARHGIEPPPQESTRYRILPRKPSTRCLSSVAAPSS